MNTEERRLQSFRGRWPHDQNRFFATPVKLAKSGFYHNPTDNFPDRVVCFCCGIALVHWNPTHDPWTEHTKRAPTCGLVTGAYRMYQYETKRLASFTTWTHPPHFSATPTKLALAGFFSCPSAQYIDRCVCFCCGIALVKWEANDDPWAEHVKHAKICPFVRGKEVGNVPIDETNPEAEEPQDNLIQTLLGQLDAMDIDAASSAPAYSLCPITQDIMVDPVVAEDGHSYERDAIKKWFQKKNTSPLTNKRLYSKKLIPNHNLRSQIIEMCENILETAQKARKQEAGPATTTMNDSLVVANHVGFATTPSTTASVPTSSTPLPPQPTTTTATAATTTSTPTPPTQSTTTTTTTATPPSTTTQDQQPIGVEE